MDILKNTVGILKFAPLLGEIGFKFFGLPVFKMACFVSALIYRTPVLRRPSAIVSERVNTAFDRLAKGMFIFDEHGQIVLANRIFTEKIGRPMSSNPHK
ncbi:hypothetical protein MGMO_52c00070 [Methyloglobulus morosus KoM1]|uniref:PAS domain-containing protein n=1 Tax=Methyloglobulus morosus KoM1 TaxID=1116472 RepID=V5C7F1_9GAMM|nr:hypothetical protein MGMO_52c00070 [Methyloglobulus morosus KoM1]